MQVNFPGITVQQDEAALILHSELPLHTLSSAVVGGSFTKTQTIINRHVDKDYNDPDPIRDLQRFAGARDITDFVGLLTAVWTRKARAVMLRAGDLTVCTVITAGVRNATAVGVSRPFVPAVGTINIIVLVDGQFVPEAMVNAVMTITEAKTAILLERDIRTPEGHPATGTSTDAVVLACTGRGPSLAYGGPVTPVGHLIGRCVRDCLGQALDAE